MQCTTFRPPIFIPPTHTRIILFQLMSSLLYFAPSSLKGVSDGSSASPSPTAAPINLNLTRADWWKKTTQEMKHIQPNRIIYVDAAVSNSKSGLPSENSPALPLSHPRYSLWVLDVELSSSSNTRAPVKAAVLVLPQGRESEWQFRSVTGGSELARSHGFDRIVFVGLNRGQTFTGLDQVQKELAPLLRPFQPMMMGGTMPIVAIGSDVGARREVFRSTMTTSGGSHNNSSSSSESTVPAAADSLVVEDVLVGDHVHRRLIIGESGLVQSEARLNVSPSYLTMTAAQRKAKAKKRKANAKKKAAAAASVATSSEGEPKADADGDDNELDADDDETNANQPLSTTTSDATFPVPTCAPSPSSSLIQYNYLPCNYQIGLVSCLSLLPSPPVDMTLVGLGGGGLSMYFHHLLPSLSLDVIELDPQVLESAWRFFGFRQDWKRLRCHVGDGIEVIQQMSNKLNKTAADLPTDAVNNLSLNPSSSSIPGPPLPAQLQDLVLIDVNNTDLGEGLSFPPPVFLTDSFLQSARSILKPTGWFMLNLGCRNKALREEILNNLHQHFTHLFVLKPAEDDVNCVVAATNDVNFHPTAITFESVTQRLNHYHHSSDGSKSTFQCDKEMVQECVDALKKVQRLSRSAPSVVELTPIFPSLASD